MVKIKIGETYLFTSFQGSWVRWKAINFLENHYQTVLLPSFETQKMRLSSRSRGINRIFDELGHSIFKRRLLERVDSNFRVVIVNESYTSKTCSNCGYLKFDLGSDRLYQCDQCNISIDRDINGARNILIKHLNIPDDVPVS